MASHPADLYHPGKNELKAPDQRRQGKVSPGSRERLGENGGIKEEVEEQETRCISSESTAHLKTLKPTTVSPFTTADTDTDGSSASTDTSGIPTMHSATSRQETKLTSREQALTSSTPALEVLNISSQTEVTVGPSGSKSKAPNMSHNLKAACNANITAKISPKNNQKIASTPRTAACPKILHKTTSVSQISCTDSPKSLNRMSLTHRPRADKTATEIKKEKTKTLISRKLNDAKMKTAEVSSVALQTDVWPVCVDAEVQVFVEVAGKHTDMSPIHSPQSCVQPAVASPDPPPKQTRPRFLGPPPYKSPNIQKPVQHVCQIEIELCSQRCVSSAPPSITVSECDAVCDDEQMNREQKNSVKTTEMEGENEGSVAPQDIVWDEQGMTWEVYGASLDLESLGFAIQNHLQCKIQEHERRIATLRKSVCLSEQWTGKSRTGNVFRSLFSGCKCCWTPRPK